MLNNKSLLVFWGVFVVTVSAVSCTPHSAAPIINDTTKDAVIECETAQQAVDDTNDTGGIAHISANEPPSISVVNENLDILLADYGEFNEEKEYINDHPEAFAAIVALGEDAIPHLDNVSEGFVPYDSSAENYRRIMAMMAKHAIKPELYDLIYPSPDGKTELKLSPLTFHTLWDPFTGITYTVSIIDAETGTPLTPANTATEVMGDFDVDWSPNSKYAAVTRSHRHDFTDVIIFDIQGSKLTVLPDRAAIEAALEKELVIYDSQTGSTYDRLHCYFDSWGEDGVTVAVVLKSANGDEISVGELTVDLKTGEMTAK